MTDSCRAEIVEMIEEFFGCTDSEVSVEDLNEIASALSDGTGWVMSKLLESCRCQSVSEWKREILCVTIFELCAEDPVWQLWLDVLPEIMASPSLWWILIRSYQDLPGLLLSHLAAIEKKTT